MDKTFWKRAAWELIKTALLTAVFCLFFEAIFALIIRAATPSEIVIGRTSRSKIEKRLKNLLQKFCIRIIIVKKS